MTRTAVPPEFKAKVTTAIRDHIAEHGPTNWKLILDQFKVTDDRPEGVHEQTLWRWIREVRTRPHVPPRLIDAAVEQIAARTDGVLDQRQAEASAAGLAEITRDIPAGPSPAYLAKSGARGLQNIDFMVELKSLYADGQMLRQYAMKVVTDPNTGEQTEAIKNPAAFEKSIQRRASILDTALKAMGEIWDLRMQQQFYETIIDEIGKADPAVQRRILDRLAVLNQRTGMTLNARM